MRSARRDELDDGFVRDQMAVADVGTAKRFCDAVEKHDPLAFFGGEELEEGVQVHWGFVGHIVIHPIEEHEGDTRFQCGFGKRGLLFNSDC